MKQKIRHWLINFLVKNLYKGVREQDILASDDKGNLYFRGKQIPTEQKNQLVREANLIQNTKTFRFIFEEMQHLAERDIITSKNSSDEYFAKSQLYVLQVIRKKLDNLSKL